MCKKEKKISHSNESNRINDSTYDASVNSSDVNTVNDFRERTGIAGRNNNKTIKEIQIKYGDPSDTYNQWIKVLLSTLFGCGFVFILNKEKFL